MTPTRFGSIEMPSSTKELKSQRRRSLWRRRGVASVGTLVGYPKTGSRTAGAAADRRLIALRDIPCAHEFQASKRIVHGASLGHFGALLHEGLEARAVQIGE